MKTPLLQVRVVGIRHLTPRISEYLLESIDGNPLPKYDAGAHIELHLEAPEMGRFVRHYSLIGGDRMVKDPANRYRIAVQREDRARGSAFIHEHLDIGTELSISWPKNHFVLGHNDPRVLLIAGGIGITPIYSMLQSLARRGRDYSFVYSGRTEEGMAYLEETMALAGERGEVHLSGEPAIDHLDLKALLAAQPENCIAYVCGPEAMVNAAYAAGAELGWPEERIRSERFGVAAAGEDLAFEVVLEHSQKRVAVGRNTSILDAAEAAGLSLLSDCRRGECGLCSLPVISSSGPIDHRDRYLSDEEKASGDAICLCVSRIQGGTLVIDA
ncbi:PDR/VanB family oxidoreductase [Marinobacterium sp. YM272]|uniref:PDR/VanB family oxidoreductase n=1 Tax=Marinobacterium sp. YM272 TaxID=3421654 RepID=UPI003D7FFB14